MSALLGVGVVRVELELGAVEVLLVADEPLGALPSVSRSAADTWATAERRSASAAS
ncbi:hypothetical protein [Streptomyces alfalfae]